MKERSILFSTEMVSAILEGRKTQTRRLMGLEEINFNPNSWKFIGELAGSYKDKSKSVFRFVKKLINEPINIACPTIPGDQLWVRESHFVMWDFSNNIITVLFRDGVSIRFYYKDLPLNTIKKLKKRRSLNKSWVPGRFMPKAFCRTWLQNEVVKVERLQDISEDDAIAEGVIEYEDGSYHNYFTQKGLRAEDGVECLLAKGSYQSLWSAINGLDSWKQNPWVWAITFKVLSTNGKLQVQEMEVANG